MNTSSTTSARVGCAWTANLSSDTLVPLLTALDASWMRSAACFTHPEVSFVGLTEEQARAKAEEEGFEVVVKKTSFKANSKALAEKEADGMAKLIYRPDTEEILGMWIMGLHLSLIHI